MAEKKVGVKWEVDVSQLDRATKAQTEYNKKLKEFAERLKESTRASARMDEANRRGAAMAALATRQNAEAATRAKEQAEATQRAAAEVDNHTRKTEENSQKTDDNTKKKKENAQGQDDNTDATNKNSTAWTANAKQLVFWAASAASVFRLVMKLKQAFTEAVSTITKNTEAAERLSVAQDTLKVSFAGAIGDSERWQGVMDRTAIGVEWFAGAVTIAAATMKGFGAVAAQEFQNTAIMVIKMGQAAEAAFSGDYATANRLIAESIDMQALAADRAQIYLDSYGASLEESARAQDEFRAASLKTADSLDEQKDRSKELEKAQKSLFDLQQALADAQKTRLEALADLETERLRRLQDIDEETQRALADTALKGARKREDIEIAYRRRMEDLEGKKSEALTRIAERLALKLLRIEMRYREKMIRIGENFDDAIFGAILKRDATAALMAMRRKARDEGRAQRERSNAITIANAEAAMQRAQAARAQEERRENAALIRQRALEDLARDQARRRQDILKNHKRELADLGLFLQRSKDDIELAYQRRIAKARERHAQEEKEYRAHLNRQYVALRGHITRVNQAVANLSEPHINPFSVTPLSAGMALGELPVSPPSTTPPTTGRTHSGEPFINSHSGTPHINPFAQPDAPGGANDRIQQPDASGGRGTFSGSINHQISGSIDAAMAGFEGRLSAAITDVVIEVMGGMLQ